MAEYDRDQGRYLAFMKNIKQHGLDWMKRCWYSEICPKGIAKNVLEHAGCDFDNIDKTWVITLRNTAEAKKKVEDYYNA